MAWGAVASTVPTLSRLPPFAPPASSESRELWKLFYTILRARKRREFDPLLDELDGCRVAQKPGRRSDAAKAHDQRIDELLELCRFFDGLSNTISKSGKGIERATKILARVLGGAR